MDTLFDKIVELLDETDPNYYYKTKVYLVMFKILTNVIQDLDILSQKFKLHSLELWKCAENMISSLKDSFLKANEEKAKEWAVVLHEWSALNRDGIAKAWKESTEYSFIEYLVSDEFVKIFYDIIFLAFPRNAVFFDSGNKRLNEIIYSCKHLTLKIVSTLVSIFKPQIHMDTLKDTSFIKLLESLTPAFLSELLELGKNRELESLLSNARLSELVSIVLTWWAQFTYIKEFQTFFINHDLCLLTDIGFPFLRTFKFEKIEMRENPSEFVKLALDVWDRQKLSCFKSQAAKFIEWIADKIPGMVVPIGEICWDWLVYAITKDPNMEKYPSLNLQYRNSTFFSIWSDEDLIDISLVVLTMLSYILPKNEGMRAKFVEIWEKVTKPIMERESLLLNWRLTVMLGYYIDILYKN